MAQRLVSDSRSGMAVDLLLHGHKDLDSWRVAPLVIMGELLMECCRHLKHYAELDSACHRAVCHLALEDSADSEASGSASRRSRHGMESHRTRPWRALAREGLGWAAYHSFAQCFAAVTSWV